MCICLVFGGKQLLTIIAYTNIIVSMVSLGNHLIKYRSTKVECCQYLCKYKFYFYICKFRICNRKFQKYIPIFKILFVLYSFYIIHCIRLLLLVI